MTACAYAEVDSRRDIPVTKAFAIAAISSSPCVRNGRDRIGVAFDPVSSIHREESQAFDAFSKIPRIGSDAVETGLHLASGRGNWNCGLRMQVRS